MKTQLSVANSCQLLTTVVSCKLQTFVVNSPAVDDVNILRLRQQAWVKATSELDELQGVTARSHHNFRDLVQTNLFQEHSKAGITLSSERASGFSTGGAARPPPCMLMKASNAACPAMATCDKQEAGEQ